MKEMSVLSFLFLISGASCQLLDSNDSTTNTFRVLRSPQNKSKALSDYLNKEEQTREPEQCALPDGRLGECVLYFLCDLETRSVITDGSVPVSANANTYNDNNNNCSNYLYMCCDVGINRVPEGCGWRNPDGVRLWKTSDINGKSKFGEFPWTCALLRVVPVNESDPDGFLVREYRGVGSLIHPSVVLTAAHLIDDYEMMIVRAGEWDQQTDKESYLHQERFIENIAVHENFNKNNFIYDVALLFLTEPMNLAPNVGVICLPPPREETPEATLCLGTGWGKDMFGRSGHYQTQLKKVELSIVDHGTCELLLRQTRLGRYFGLHSTFMCAGGELDMDMCTGDGGAPLACPIQGTRDRYIQTGIVSWGIGCFDPGVPGVYANVSTVRDWIDTKMIAKGYDPKVYTF